MSAYSDYRVGNIVTLVKGANNFEHCFILEVDQVTQSSFVLKSTQDGRTISFTAEEANYPHLMANRLRPPLLGFQQLNDFLFSNGTVDLTDIVEVDDSDEEITEDTGFVIITKFAKSGYAVQRSRNENFIFEGQWENATEQFLGITDVHELQNFYSDELPDLTLDLDAYIKYMLERE